MLVECRVHITRERKKTGLANSWEEKLCSPLNPRSSGWSRHGGSLGWSTSICFRLSQFKLQSTVYAARAVVGNLNTARFSQWHLNSSNYDSGKFVVAKCLARLSCFTAAAAHCTNHNCYPQTLCSLDAAVFLPPS